MMALTHHQCLTAQDLFDLTAQHAMCHPAHITYLTTLNRDGRHYASAHGTFYSCKENRCYSACVLMLRGK